jgi:hypothetical protein
MAMCRTVDDNSGEFVSQLRLHLGPARAFTPRHSPVNLGDLAYHEKIMRLVATLVAKHCELKVPLANPSLAESVASRAARDK